uniref:Uncharacterized protein n=1 Tax=Aegilops tauschii TaxID=37682 RepID=M8ATJ0_AEGTA
MAFDPVQQLLAVGTLDGRIKIFGGDNIEGILITPKSMPYKYLQEFGHWSWHMEQQHNAKLLR